MADRKYIVGNWKMNGLAESLDVLAQIASGAALHPAVDVAIAPPATLIARASGGAGVIGIGAQDCHAAASGAHTGCLSAAMIAEAGAQFSIIGHSERRADQHETSADVAAKAAALHAVGMGAILCIGETLAERDSGNAVAIVCDQLEQSLPASADSGWLTIAYEPVWAIGTGRIPEMADIAEMHGALRGVLTRILGEGGQHIRILYGGSVNPGNAADILPIPDVGGALVGGASLKAETFLPIVEAAAAL
ncbi:MAG: triose-phosphate isomerase [Blastomonas sp.]